MRCNLCDVDDALLLGVRDALSSRTAAKWPYGEFRVVKCRGCGLIYVNPMPRFNAETLRECYTWYSSNYASEFEAPKSSELERAMFLASLEEIERYVAPGRILDVGCADGLFLNVARDRGWAPVGVEVAPQMAAYARDVRKLSVLDGPLEDARLERESFDAVHMHHVLEHLTDPAATLRLASSLLRQGGLLSVGVPNEGTLLKTVGHLYFKLRGETWTTYLKPPLHLYGFSAKTLRRMLNVTGYQIISVFGSYRGDPNYKPYSVFPETTLLHPCSGGPIPYAQQLIRAVEKRLKIPENLVALATR